MVNLGNSTLKLDLEYIFVFQERTSHQHLLLYTEGQQPVGSSRTSYIYILLVYLS